MEIVYICTTWGQKFEGWDAFCRKAKQAGYDGIETSFPPTEEKQEFLDSLKKYQLVFIVQHWVTTSIDFDAHKSEYADRIRSLTSLKPLSVNSHTGKDHFSFEQNSILLRIASEISGETGVPVYHETHRGRFAFAAHITRTYLENSHPELTLDVSHWCSVAESLLEDQIQSLNMALDHTRHIHARIGFEQGPQVCDFTLPQYQPALQFHLKCWDKVVLNHKQSSRLTLPITPEFGPPPYMQGILQEAAADKQWKMNVDMMNMLKDRYS